MSLEPPKNKRKATPRTCFTCKHMFYDFEVPTCLRDIRPIGSWSGGEHETTCDGWTITPARKRTKQNKKA